MDAAAIDRFVSTHRRVSRIPGVAVSIVRRDGPVYAAGFGEAGSDGAAVSPDTPFLIGSVTKTITALAIAQLVDAGKVRFDDPVREHLPGFALRDPDASGRITLRHLLTHTSGLSQWSGHDARAQREARFDHVAPVRPPGESFEYSSLNFIILGRVIEAVSGMAYGEYVASRIFEPLGMRSSFAHAGDAAGRGLAPGAWYLFGLTVRGREPQPPAALVPAGFVVSTARDMGAYLSMLLDDGAYQGRQIVSAESLRAMFTPWDGEATGPGMAWGIGQTMIAHAGNTRTFSARAALLPRDGYGIVVLANVNSGPFFPATKSLLDGTARIVRGGTVTTFRPDEMLVKGVILVTLLLGLFQFVRTALRWARRGFPPPLPRSGKGWFCVAIEALLAVVILIAVPRWIGVPLRVLIEYFPDLGMAMVLSVAAGLLRALLKAGMAASEPARAAGMPAGG